MKSYFLSEMESKQGPELKRCRVAFTGVLRRDELAVVQPLLVELNSPKAELRKLRPEVLLAVLSEFPFVIRGANPFNLKLTEPIDCERGGGEGGGGLGKKGLTFNSLPLSLPGNVQTRSATPSRT